MAVSWEIMMLSYPWAKVRAKLYMQLWSNREEERNQNAIISNSVLNPGNKGGEKQLPTKGRGPAEAKGGAALGA